MHEHSFKILIRLKISSIMFRLQFMQTSFWKQKYTNKCTRYFRVVLTTYGPLQNTLDITNKFHTFLSTAWSLKRSHSLRFSFWNCTLIHSCTFSNEYTYEKKLFSFHSSWELQKVRVISGRLLVNSRVQILRMTIQTEIYISYVIWTLKINMS